MRKLGRYPEAEAAEEQWDSVRQAAMQRDATGLSSREQPDEGRAPSTGQVRRPIDHPRVPTSGSPETNLDEVEEANKQIFAYYLFQGNRGTFAHHDLTR